MIVMLVRVALLISRLVLLRLRMILVLPQNLSRQDQCGSTVKGKLVTLVGLAGNGW
jgi:hypothetical protein